MLEPKALDELIRHDISFLTGARLVERALLNSVENNGKAMHQTAPNEGAALVLQLVIMSVRKFQQYVANSGVEML